MKWLVLLGLLGIASCMPSMGKNVNIEKDGSINITDFYGKNIVISKGGDALQTKHIEIRIAGYKLPLKIVKVDEINHVKIEGRGNLDRIFELFREYQGNINEEKYQSLLHKIQEAVLVGDVSPMVHKILEKLDIDDHEATYIQPKQEYHGEVPKDSEQYWNQGREGVIPEVAELYKKHERQGVVPKVWNQYWNQDIVPKVPHQYWNQRRQGMVPEVLDQYRKQERQGVLPEVLNQYWNQERQGVVPEVLDQYRKQERQGVLPEVSSQYWNQERQGVVPEVLDQYWKQERQGVLPEVSSQYWNQERQVVVPEILDQYRKQGRQGVLPEVSSQYWNQERQGVVPQVFNQYWNQERQGVVPRFYNQFWNQGRQVPEVFDQYRKQEFQGVKPEVFSPHWNQISQDSRLVEPTSGAYQKKSSQLPTWYDLTAPSKLQQYQQEMESLERENQVLRQYVIEHSRIPAREQSWDQYIDPVRGKESVPRYWNRQPERLVQENQMLSQDRLEKPLRGETWLREPLREVSPAQESVLYRQH